MGPAGRWGWPMLWPASARLGPAAALDLTAGVWSACGRLQLLRSLERENARLEAALEWRHREPVFWQWMVSPPFPPSPPAPAGP